MLSLLFAAGEPSKVPFYVAGGVFVVWAVALAAIGLMRPSFPGGAGGARGVMALSALLALVTMAMAVETSAFVK